jgi:hypothetical protein
LIIYPSVREFIRLCRLEEVMKQDSH